MSSVVLISYINDANETTIIMTFEMKDVSTIDID